MVNPLVAQEQSSTTAVSGISVLEGARDLKQSIESGDWASTALGAAGAGLDALGFVLDPFGSILAAGVGWLMEHVGPLKDALDALAGNPDAVKAHSETWKNISKELGEIGTDLANQVSGDLNGWSGPAADAYRQRAKDVGDLFAAAKEAGEGTANGIETAGQVVAAVRTLVRDIIAELVGHLISWALQVVFTLGIGLAWVVPQVVAAVAKTAAKIADLVSGLAKALKALGQLLKKAGGIFTDTAGKLKKIKGDKPSAPAKQDSLPSGPKSVDPMAGKGGGTPPASTPKGGPTNVDKVAPPPKLGDTTPSGTPKSSPTPDAPSVTPPPKLGDTTPSGTPKSSPTPDAPSVTPPPKLGDTTPSGSTTPSGASGGGSMSPPPKLDTTPPETPRSLGSGDTGAPVSPPPKLDDTAPSGVKTTPSASPDTPKIKDRNTNPHENGTPVTNRSLCGDPIDVATGWMILSQTDVEMAGALPLEVTRTHISSYGLGRWFGPSWASTLDQRLEVEEDGLHLALADGTLLSYPVPAGEDEVFPSAGPRLPLRRNALGYEVTDPEADRVLLFAATVGDRLPLRVIADGDGNRVEIIYDASGVPAELRHSGGYRLLVETEGGLITALRLPGQAQPVLAYRYDEQRRLVEVINESGRPMRFTYDASGRIVRWEDRNGMWYRYGFDTAGRCVRAEGAGGYLNYQLAYDRENLVTTATDSLGAVTRYQLDERLRVIAETDPLGNTKRFELDEFGRLLSRTDALGRTTRFEYDEAGNVVGVTRPDGTRALARFNERRRPVEMVGPDGGVWRREYDERGKVVRTTDPAGSTTDYAYDAAGNLAAITDSLGGVTRIEHNAAGLPATITDPLGNSTRYTYDEFGRPATITDPLGNTTRLDWAADGELRRRVDPDGAAWSWKQDAEGNTNETVDARGLVTRTEYAHFDLPVAEIGPDGDRLAYTYDTELRLVAVTNERGLSWRYSYDPAGNLVSETDFNGRVVRYAYDATGQLVRRVNGAGEAVTFEYDALGQVVRRVSGTDVATFAYDPAGRMISARNADAEVTFTYDALGRTVTESINGRVLRSAYDALGRRLRRTTPSGAESVFGYDAAGHPVALRTFGRTLRFTYDPAGRELSRSFGPAELRQTWDGNHRLASQTLTQTPAGPARVVQHREYSYLRDGLLTSVADGLSGPREVEVDRSGRVRSVRGQGWLESYGYDLTGAVVHAGWPGAAEAAGPRQYSGTLLTAAGGLRYRHDAQGRTVLRQLPGGQTWQYQWNADDRMVGVVTPEGQRWRYRYDALGRRIAKQLLGPDGRIIEQTEFAWDGTELAEQVRSGAGLPPVVTVWDWAPGQEQPLAQTEHVLGSTDERFYAIVTDLVGSPSELLDEAGNVAWHPRTTLWGRLLSPPGQAYTPLRFPGQYHDPETGLHYNFHRYYDPETGRYLSHDPLGLDPAPDSLSYVDNPFEYVDPLGLAPTSCKKGSGGGGKKGGGKKGSAASHKGKNGILGPHNPSKVKKPAQPRQSYTDGTHGAKGREQTRLGKMFDTKVSGNTHESEHPIGYEVLGRGSGASRGENADVKNLENHAPAYQEDKASHRAHIGTGTSTRTAESGFTAQSYRDAQRTLMENGRPSDAVQLNQLDYAHQTEFGQAAGTKGGKIADDSYHNMVSNMEGKPVEYATGPGTKAATPNVSRDDVVEMHLARDTARTGRWPTWEQEMALRYKEPTAEDWAALERGERGGPDISKVDMSDAAVKDSIRESQARMQEFIDKARANRMDVD